MGTGDSTGETGDPGVDELQPGECVANHNPDKQGIRHQCEGTVDFSLEFDIPLIAGTENCINMQNLIPDGQLCTESHAFGSEPYELAQVINCCGPWAGDAEHEATYLTFCEADLANQLCHTLVDRLEYHLQNNHFMGFETQANNIISSVANNISQCTEQFRTNDVDPSPSRLDSKYKLPNNKSLWPSFVDFTIDVEIGEITGFTLPAEESEWLECSGMQGNDGDTFPKPQGFVSGDPYATVLASPMVAGLSGPMMFGAPISGQVGIQSHDSGCVDPWCSSATFTAAPSSGEWAIEHMRLFADSNVTLTNGTLSQDMVDVRLVLADVALGVQESGASSYVVGAGEAFFWVVGRGADDPTSTQRFLASTSTDIVATLRSGGDWHLSSFEIEYVHHTGSVWTIAIPASDWR